MSKVIEFPDVKYLLNCRECGSNAFFVFLGSTDPYNITELECEGCERVFLPTDSEISYPKSVEKEGDKTMIK